MNEATTSATRGQPVMSDCCSTPSAMGTAAVTARGRRGIGPWGTAARLAGGIGALVWALAIPHHHPWLALPGAGSRLWGSVGGLVVIPAVITLALAWRGRDARPVRLGAASAMCVTVFTLFVAGQLYPVAVLMFLGATLLVAAARGDDGCEVLTVPNWVLGRDDYLFCLPFTPIDAWEARRHVTNDQGAVQTKATQ